MGFNFFVIPLAAFTVLDVAGSVRSTIRVEPGQDWGGDILLLSISGKYNS